MEFPAGKHQHARMTLQRPRQNLARSTPSDTRLFSIAEIVACGIPVALASWFWLSTCSSRMIRTDSPTETLIRFFAGR